MRSSVEFFREQTRQHPGTAEADKPQTRRPPREERQEHHREKEDAPSASIISNKRLQRPLFSLAAYLSLCDCLVFLPVS